MFVLPALLLTLDKWSTTKGFEEPLMDIYEEPGDMDLQGIDFEKPEKL